MQLLDVFKMSNRIEEFLDFQSKHVELPVLLFGGGAACEYFMRFMQKYSILVSGIIDKKKAFIVEKNVKLLTLEEACNEYEGAIVVISAIAHKNQIVKEIASKQYNCFTFCFDPTLEVLQQRSCGERRSYFAVHKRDLFNLKNDLSDRQSEIVFDNVVEGAITSNTDCYLYSSSESQYFPEFIKQNLSEEETFVDLGAFIGDSIEEFMIAVNNKFRKIYAFEPDSSNLHIAKTNLHDIRIEFHQSGVGKESGVLYLAGKDEATHCVVVGNEETEKVEIVKLDDAIKEKVTYIKMDIEGMELDALKGAEQLICRYKPKLAISIYHKMEDMVEIPNYIRKLGLNYKFYMRHFWNCNGTDVILFAI